MSHRSVYTEAAYAWKRAQRIAAEQRAREDLGGRSSTPPPSAPRTMRARVGGFARVSALVGEALLAAIGGMAVGGIAAESMEPDVVHAAHVEALQRGELVKCAREGRGR